MWTLGTIALFNYLIAAYTNLKSIKSVFQIFDYLKIHKYLKLDVDTINYILLGCYKYKLYDLTLKLYKEINKINIKPNLLTFEILILIFILENKNNINKIYNIILTMKNLNLFINSNIKFSILKKYGLNVDEIK